MQKHLPLIATICLLLSVVFQAAAMGLLKGASGFLKIEPPNHLVAGVLYTLCLGCLGFQAIAWQLALRRYPLSTAYLVMTLVYVLILIISVVVFKEHLNMAQLIGSGVIIAGVSVLSLSIREKKSNG